MFFFVSSYSIKLVFHYVCVHACVCVHDVWINLKFVYFNHWHLRICHSNVIIIIVVYILNEKKMRFFFAHSNHWSILKLNQRKKRKKNIHARAMFQFFFGKSGTQKQIINYDWKKSECKLVNQSISNKCVCGRGKKPFIQIDSHTHTRKKNQNNHWPWLSISPLQFNSFIFFHFGLINYFWIVFAIITLLLFRLNKCEFQTKKKIIIKVNYIDHICVITGKQKIDQHEQIEWKSKS